MNRKLYHVLLVFVSACFAGHDAHNRGDYSTNLTLAVCMTNLFGEIGILRKRWVHGSIAYHLFRGLGISRIHLFADLNVGSEDEAVALRKIVSHFLGAKHIRVNYLALQGRKKWRSLSCNRQRDNQKCRLEFVQMWEGIEACFEQIRTAERKGGSLYSWVLRLRADIFWHRLAPPLTSFNPTVVSSAVRLEGIILSPRAFADVAFRGTLKYYNLFEKENHDLLACFDGEAIFEHVLAHHNIPMERRAFGGVIVRKSLDEDQANSDCSEAARENIKQDVCQALLYGLRTEPAVLSYGIDAASVSLPVRSDMDCVSLDVQVRKEVLVLTPLKNAASHLASFADGLRSLSYPHDLISVAFLVSDSTDHTLQMLQSLIATRHFKGFAEVMVFEEHFHFRGSKDRHDLEGQAERRMMLARSRNELLRRALHGDVFGVFWIDVDVWTYPATLIEDILSLGRPVVAPHIKIGTTTYDKNTWRENNPKAAFAEDGNPRYVFEGYESMLHDMGSRDHMDDLEVLASAMGAGDNKLFGVAVDGVGTALLYVEARVHRHPGISFPEKPYKHRIESEGFGLLASDYGFRPCGLPNYIVYHRDEWAAPPPTPQPIWVPPTVRVRTRPPRFRRPRVRR